MEDNFLSRHHDALEAQIGALLARADRADPDELAVAWDRFEHELLEHLHLEESELLPRFAREHPDEAAALTHEHERLRAEALALGDRPHLHVLLRSEGAKTFAQALLAHAMREDRLLYTWAEGHLGPDSWARIERGLRGAANAASGFVAR